MAIIYKHIRKDTNEIFYIGIGKTKYRINSKSGRNHYWHNIVNKHGYTTEIILENITWEAARNEEIRLIAKYGRKDLGNGTLVNMTDGGDGVENLSNESRKKISDAIIGTIRSEESKEKNRIAHLGKKMSKETRNKMSISGKSKSPMSIITKKKISDSLTGKPKSSEHTEKLRNRITTDETRQKLRTSHIGQIPWNVGKSPCQETKNKISYTLKGNSNSKRKSVTQYTLNDEYIQRWNTITDAVKSLNISAGNISECCSGNRKTAGGYKWEYNK
jgi:hypothetical protein